MIQISTGLMWTILRSLRPLVTFTILLPSFPDCVIAYRSTQRSFTPATITFATPIFTLVRLVGLSRKLSGSRFYLEADPDTFMQMAGSVLTTKLSMLRTLGVKVCRPDACNRRYGPGWTETKIVPIFPPQMNQRSL